MPFDPAFPPTGAELISSEFRAQFTGLFDLIQTIPVGPVGPAGTSVSGAVVDSVTTANPGEAAAASASFDGANVHFTFTIPKGAVGAQGIQGDVGPAGGIGPVGPAFTSFVIDSVTTLDPAQPATVTVVFDGTSVKLSFGLPSGRDGAAGAQGPMGVGTQGPTGPPFTSFVVDSVTALDPVSPPTATATYDGTDVRLSFGIPRGFQGNDGATGPAGPQDLRDTARNPATALLSMSLGGSYDQTEVQRIADKVDELITALRRV